MHCCYKRDWFCKRGGCMAISALTARLSVKWCVSYELEFLRGLLFVFSGWMLLTNGTPLTNGTVRSGGTAHTRGASWARALRGAQGL